MSALISAPSGTNSKPARPDGRIAGTNVVKVSRTICSAGTSEHVRINAQPVLHRTGAKSSLIYGDAKGAHERSRGSEIGGTCHCLLRRDR